MVRPTKNLDVSLGEDSVEKLASYGILLEDIAEFFSITEQQLITDYKLQLIAGYSRAKNFKHPLWDAYRQQKGRAAQRGICWEFNFPLWLGKWLESGKASKRGRCAGQYVMARKGDAGPYSYDNTEIITAEQNHVDAHINGCRW